MPEMDGLEATRLIREREALSNQHVPIIAMTAQAMKGDRDRCLEAGMDNYLSKPIRSRQVLEAIERALARHTSDDAAQTRREGSEDERVAASSLPTSNVASSNGAVSTQKPHTPGVEDAGTSGPTDDALPFRLNRTAALAAVDGDEALLADVADAFLTEAPQLLELAEAACKAGDAAALKRAAHTLKGAVSSFGEHPAVALSLTVERAAAAGEIGLARDSLPKLQDALRPLLDDLRAFVTDAKPASRIS
jgi:HPt (histidine-containing phosphotransfer) domain-containing protein